MSHWIIATMMLLGIKSEPSLPQPRLVAQQAGDWIGFDYGEFSERQSVIPVKRGDIILVFRGE